MLRMGLCPQRHDGVPAPGLLAGPVTVRVNTDPSPGAGQETGQVVSSVPDSAVEDLCRARPEFELIGQIGEGAFARVYLARQHDLGGRLVALKVSSEEVGEALLLARLLHTNIVPIYSTHRLGYFHAVCMPYMGSTTLADLIQAFRTSGLPASGRQLVSTLQSHRATPRQDEDAGRAGAAGERPAWPGDDLPVLPPTTQVTLDSFAELSYVESVVWIAQQLADGLAHAHDRGVIHRDLKPANVLLTDDGTPLLLDFNLAEDAWDTRPPQMGGTLPYTAPEALKRILGEGGARGGVRGDLYSLGLILYELLTGKLPGPACQGGVIEYTRRLAEVRSQPAPPLRPLNPAVSPALESIIRHCLEPNPDHRYQSARELQEDLKRQRENRPLRFAPDPSRLERARKWARRHPRLASLAVALVAGVAVSVALASGLAGYRAWALRLDAERSLEQLTEEAVQTKLCLAGISSDANKQAADRAREALAPYEALEDPRWRDRPRASYLPAEKRERLEVNVSSLLLILARDEAGAVSAAKSGAAATEEGQRRIRAALDLNARAGEAGGERHLTRAVLAQKAALLEMQGAQEAKQVRQQADAEQPRGPADAAMTGRDLVVLGQHKQALPFLLDATRQAPEDAASWLLLGRCQEALNQDRDAIASYSTVLGLRPGTGLAHFRRGAAYLRCNDNRQALEDFDRAIELGHATADAHINRGLALHRLKRYEEAVREIDRAIALNAPYTRVYFIRARIREDAGDRTGAGRDRETGLRLEPDDELSWLARGLARVGGDDRGALADFRKALDINPRSPHALVNAAHVLSERLGMQEDALALLNRAVQAHPAHTPARANRGLVLARLGRREEAHQDARTALAACSDPKLLFLVGTLYAQTSTAEAKDRDEAIRLLRLALLRGHGHDQIEHNRDLEPLRKTAEFKRLVSAAQGLRESR